MRALILFREAVELNDEMGKPFLLEEIAIKLALLIYREFGLVSWAAIQLNSPSPDL